MLQVRLTHWWNDGKSKQKESDLLMEPVKGFKLWAACCNWLSSQNLSSRKKKIWSHSVQTEPNCIYFMWMLCSIFSAVNAKHRFKMTQDLCEQTMFAWMVNELQSNTSWPILNTESRSIKCCKRISELVVWSEVTECLPQINLLLSHWLLTLGSNL